MEESSRKRVAIDLDRLPIKRLNAIDEIGNEQFLPDVSNEDKRLGMLRRIDFSSIVADSIETRRNQKRTSKEAAPGPQQTWPWQGFVENLQLAHQELSVIIDLINTVEANDAVAVAGMQRPKQLPNEILSDLAVSAATKLQRLRNLGRYFKQSSKALEQRVSREARFYGSLIRLQQHWKVKRQRVSATSPGNEGFSFDLVDNTSSNTTILSHPLPNTLVHIVRETAGLLAIQRPQKSHQCISISYSASDFNSRNKKSLKRNIYKSDEILQANRKETLTDEDVNSWVKDTHSVLHEIHQSIFLQQVFDRVKHESYSPSPGINVTGMREDFLQLAVGQDTTIYLSLVPFKKEDEFLDSMGHSQNTTNEHPHSDSSALVVINEKDVLNENNFGVPSSAGLEIYVMHIFHKNSVVRLKEKKISASRAAVAGQAAADSCGLSHFCKTIAHRIFSNKVLAEIERLVSRIPFVQLLSHPPWHSRTSSWSQLHTKIVVKDDQVTVSGEGAPSTLCSFRISPNVSSVSSYECDLDDLPLILLQQIAGRIIQWLHDEALIVGMKVRRDFLCLYFDLDQGDMLGLVARVDPDDVNGCISWWLITEDALQDDGKFSTSTGEYKNRRFLGHLSLEALYFMLMDLVNVSTDNGFS
ncbi:mediator of RNA polymerase II transcription subunit 17-like isoform X2 [Zingiber officinale]|uniref:mediator of RNA polymerase II transcription subunit 17-like isoform X2 n=1 Tax=Zingiber officinale TaxID=94328 RepID=UPI001C4BA108|nr:mediator of RNA polymerase II transcription subunit 17-like isoform X2 [Zingiber officinale]